MQGVRFLYTTDDGIKDHIFSLHQSLLAKRRKLLDPELVNKNKKWKDLFTEGPEVTDAILGSLDEESFLACRLVCQGWRGPVNKYKPTWKKMKKKPFGETLFSALTKGQNHVVEMMISNVVVFPFVDQEQEVMDYKILLEDGTVEKKRSDVTTTCPIHVASRWGQTSTVEMLLDMGVSEHSQNTYNQTPLHEASLFGRTDVAKVLLSNGADVNLKDGEGDSALHGAAGHGHLDTVSLLLEHGAEVNSKSGFPSGESTPLHMAAYGNSFHHCGPPEQGNEHTLVAEALILHGASINEKNHNGDTPLHWSKRADMVEMLCSHGAEVNSRNNKNKTPLQIFFI